ncbi:MAG: hypothetical protein ACOC22_00480 [bacterium]
MLSVKSYKHSNRYCEPSEINSNGGYLKNSEYNNAPSYVRCHNYAFKSKDIIYRHMDEAIKQMIVEIGDDAFRQRMHEIEIGDIVIYFGKDSDYWWESEEECLHYAVVEAKPMVGDDINDVFVSSKWGGNKVFAHRVGTSPYEDASELMVLKKEYIKTAKEIEKKRRLT